MPASHDAAADATDTTLPLVTSVTTSLPSSVTVPNSSLVCFFAHYIVNSNNFS